MTKKKSSKKETSSTEPSAFNVGVNADVRPDNNKTTFYFVGAAVKQHPVEFGDFGIKQDLPLVWADEMVGVMPVFDNYTDAEKYAGDKFQIFQVKMENVNEA